LREKKRREEIGFYKALTQEEQSQLAGEIIGKLNSVDADTAGKFAEKMAVVIKRNSKLKDDERRRQQAEKSPTALYEEQEQRHALRVATVTRRFDWLAVQAKERMFVRD
jgi:ribosomal protein L32